MGEWEWLSGRMDDCEWVHSFPAIHSHRQSFEMNVWENGPNQQRVVPIRPPTVGVKPMTPEQILNSSNTRRRGRFDESFSDTLTKMLYSHLDCRWECVRGTQVRVCQVVPVESVSGGTWTPVPRTDIQQLSHMRHRDTYYDMVESYSCQWHFMHLHVFKIVVGFQG